MSKIQNVSKLAAVARYITRSVDFQFMKAIFTDFNTPEYSGFDTEMAREAGTEPRTMYLLLIDAPTDGSSTMMTALNKQSD